MERDLGLVTSLAILTLSALSCADEGPSQSDDIPIVLATIDLTIGTVDGSDEYVFGRISGLAADTLERIYVADRQASEIRMYGPDGAFIRQVARSGGGPGEVQSPCCLAIGPDGRLWVRDSGNGRYNSYVISVDGAVESGTIRMAHGDAWYGVRPSFRPDGQLIDVGHTQEGDVPVIVRFHRDSDGNVIEEEPIRPPPSDSLAEVALTRQTQRGLATFYFQQPFGPFHLIAHSPLGGWAEAISSQYSIRWVAAGDSVRHINRSWQGPTLTGVERDSAQRELEANLRTAGAGLGDLPFGIPDRKAPLRALQFDQIGRLWIHLTAESDHANNAHVYGLDGTPVMEIGWPKSVSLTVGFLAGDFALGVQRDSMGVERVVRLVW